MQLQYRVVTYDEEENKLEKKFSGLGGRERAMQFASQNRWSTIFTM